MTTYNIPDLLAEAVERFGDRVAFSMQSEGKVRPRATFEEVGQLVERVRRRLPSGGAPIAIVLESGFEWAIAFLAITAAGRAAVLVDADLTPSQLLGQLRHAGVSAAVTSEARLPALVQAWASAGVTGQNCDFIAIERLTSPNGAEPRMGLQRIDPTRPAVIVYTSGSTGSPKGVVLSHHAVVAAAVRVGAASQLKYPFVTLSLAPMAHAAGLHALLTVFALGGQLLLLESKKPGSVLQALRGAGVTHLLAPPVLYEMIVAKLFERVAALPRPARILFRAAISGLGRTGTRVPRVSAHIAARIFKRVRREIGPALVTIFSAGAPLKPRTAQTLLALGFDIRDAYGLTETAGVVCIVEQRFGLMPGRIGQALPGTELKIDAPGDDGAGELWVRGDQVMLGYHDAPDLTNEAIQDGWFRTGDIAQIDAKGFVRICSRAKDLILTSSGKNVYPEDVEGHFNGVSGVTEVCALGVPSGNGEMIGLAVVSELTGNDLSMLRERLAKHNTKLTSQQRVQRFFFRNAPLPRTPLRKVQRKVLLEQLLHSPAEREPQRDHA